MTSILILISTLITISYSELCKTTFTTNRTTSWIEYGQHSEIFPLITSDYNTTLCPGLVFFSWRIGSELDAQHDYLFQVSNVQVDVELDGYGSIGTSGSSLPYTFQPGVQISFTTPLSWAELDYCKSYTEDFDPFNTPALPLTINYNYTVNFTKEECDTCSKNISTDPATIIQTPVILSFSNILQPIFPNEIFPVKGYQPYRIDVSNLEGYYNLYMNFSGIWSDSQGFSPSILFVGWSPCYQQNPQFDFKTDDAVVPIEVNRTSPQYLYAIFFANSVPNYGVNPITVEFQFLPSNGPTPHPTPSIFRTWWFWTAIIGSGILVCVLIGVFIVRKQKKRGYREI